MCKLAACFLVAAVLAGQTTISVTVKTPKGQATASVIVDPAPAILSFTCTPKEVVEGGTVTCTAVFNHVAPEGGYHFPLIAAGGFTLPPTIVVAPGSDTGKISFIAPAVPNPPTAQTRTVRRFLVSAFRTIDKATVARGFPLVWLSVFQYWWTEPV